MAEDTRSGEAPPPVASGADIRTFVFADMRGYTRFTQEYGDEAASNLAARFAALVRRTVPEFDGELLELRGDEAVCVFRSARQAVRAAVGLQRTLRAPEGDEDPFALGVGIGLDCGEAVPTEGGYRGAALNRAARLCATTQGGEVFATEGVLHLTGVVPGVRMSAVRSARVKGITSPVRFVGVEPVERLPPAPVAPGPPRPRRRLLALAVVAVIAVAAGVAVLASRNAGSSRGGVAIRPNSVAVIDPRTGRVLRDIPVGKNPQAITAGFGAVWVANSAESTVRRISVTSYHRDIIGLNGTPEAIAADFQTGSIWAFDSDTGAVYQINPQVNQIGVSAAHRLKICASGGCNFGGIAAGFGRVWVTDGTGEVYAMNPTTGRFSRVPGVLPARGVHTGDGRVYTSDALDIAAINPNTLRARTHTFLNFSYGRVGLAVDVTKAYVWAVSPTRGYVFRCDPVALTCLTQHVARTMDDVLFIPPDRVWITVQGTGTLLERNSFDFGLVKTIQLGYAPTALTYAAGKLWVTIQDPHTATNQD